MLETLNCKENVKGFEAESYQPKQKLALANTEGNGNRQEAY